MVNPAEVDYQEFQTQGYTQKAWILVPIYRDGTWNPVFNGSLLEKT